jgi:hypothetical protein
MKYFVTAEIFKIFRYFLDEKRKSRLIVCLSIIFYALCLLICVYYEYKIASNFIDLENIKFLLNLKQTLIINEKLFLIEEINSHLFFLHRYEIISNYEKFKLIKFIFLMTAVALPLYFGYININDINCSLNTKRLIEKYLQYIPLIECEDQKDYFCSIKIISHHDGLLKYLKAITKKTDLTTESYNILCYHYFEIKKLTDAFFQLEDDYKINSLLITENHLETLLIIELSHNNSFFTLYTCIL